MAGSAIGRSRASLEAAGRTCVTATLLLTAASTIAADISNEAPLVEEVVVSARKRVESLQSVPLSAAVVSGAAIQSGAVATLQDLSTTLPSVTLSRGSTTDRLFIRGVGSGDNPSFEQSVGTFVDDVYHGRARSSQSNFFDIERVEVLKGPQITYFGNNAIAGALNVATKEPGTEFGVDMRGLYNVTLDNYLFEGTVNLPLNDELGLRVAALASGGDGWIEDFSTREHVPKTDNQAVRATLLWQPGNGFTAKLKGQYSDEHQEGGLPLVRRSCPPDASFGGPSGFCAAALASPEAASFDWFERAASPDQQSDLLSREAVATLSYEIGDKSFTSVTAYTDYQYGLRTDLDMVPATLFAVSAPEDYRQFSQELRIDSDTGGTFDYLAGVYYQRNRLTVKNDFNFAFLSGRVATSPPLAPLLPYLPFGQAIRFNSRDETMSGFGALTWNISSDLRSTFALRYSRIEKDFDQSIVFGTARSAYGPITAFPADVAPLAAAFAGAGGLGVAGEIPLSRSDDRLSPSLSVEYDATRRTMLYARYDSGFKAGGFNGVDTSGDRNALGFSPETVDAFELGLKTTLFSGRVVFNVDVFRSEYKDLQLAGVVPSTSGAYINRVQNAGGAVSQGLELETAWEIDAHWRTSLSLTALDAHYTRYPNATPTSEQARNNVPFQDLGDRSILFAPDFAGQWTLSWSRDVGSDLNLSISNVLYGTTRYYLGFSNDPYLEQSGYVREDLSMTLSSERGWELSLIGKNLGDKVIQTYGAALPASLGSYVFVTEPPRNVSVQFKVRF